MKNPLMNGWSSWILTARLQADGGQAPGCELANVPCPNHRSMQTSTRLEEYVCKRRLRRVQDVQLVPPRLERASSRW